MRFLFTHPLGARNRPAVVARWLRWQIASRVAPGPIVVPFIPPACLVVTRSMTGATGNVYLGLHEFEEMALLLHLLGEGDVFVDVGANVGSYTVLASAVCRARSITLEPLPAAFSALEDNIRVNRIEGLVDARRIGAAASRATLRFTTDRDTMNHVVEGESDGPTAAVDVEPLDLVLAGTAPTLMKVDVEGYEDEVLAGATRTLTSGLLAAIVEHSADTPETSRAHAQMTRAGFTPFAYDPFVRRLSPLPAPRRGNTVYVSDAAAVQHRITRAPRRQALGIDF
jgi:FkbM family methyltransferase